MMRALACSLVVLAAAACGTPTTTSKGAPAASQRAAAAAPDAGLPPTAVKAVEFGENEFTESDRNRDPFRSYASLFIEQGKKPTNIQLTVVLAQYSLDELKLVAIVTGGDYPRAMLVDPTTKGWIVKRGDFVGRPDVVHTGGTNGTDYQVYWRVDRVRGGELGGGGDLVMTREDPAQPGVPPATRVIPLHPEADNDPTSRIN